MKITDLEDLKNYIDQKILPEVTAKTVVLLSGEMGVGKTQFVRSFCELIGNKVDVSSPTFSIINEYDTDLGIIHHIDLYRIESEGELYNTGFWEIFESSNSTTKRGPIFIEWPSKLSAFVLPKEWKVIKIQITIEGDDRVIVNN